MTDIYLKNRSGLFVSKIWWVEEGYVDFVNVTDDSKEALAFDSIEHAQQNAEMILSGNEQGLFEVFQRRVSLLKRIKSFFSKARQPQ